MVNCTDRNIKAGLFLYVLIFIGLMFIFLGDPLKIGSQILGIFVAIWLLRIFLGIDLSFFERDLKCAFYYLIHIMRTRF